MVSSGIEVRMGGGWKSQRDSTAYHQHMSFVGREEKTSSMRCRVHSCYQTSSYCTSRLQGGGKLLPIITYCDHLVLCLENPYLLFFRSELWLRNDSSHRFIGKLNHKLNHKLNQSPQVNLYGFKSKTNFDSYKYNYSLTSSVSHL